MENEELIKLCSDKAQKWLTPAYDAETQAEVKRMLENPDKTELIEAFYKDLEFGTGGLRGIMWFLSQAYLALKLISFRQWSSSP